MRRTQMDNVSWQQTTFLAKSHASLIFSGWFICRYNFFHYCLYQYPIFWCWTLLVAVTMRKWVSSNWIKMLPLCSILYLHCCITFMLQNKNIQWYSNYLHWHSIVSLFRHMLYISFKCQVLIREDKQFLSILWKNNPNVSSSVLYKGVKL